MDQQEYLTQLIARCWVIPDGRNSAEEIAAWKKDVNELIRKWCFHNPRLFHRAVLGREPLFSYQDRMTRLVLDNDVTVIASGNALGKSFWAATIVLWYLYTRPNSIVTTTSSSAHQLSGVLWKNIRSAWLNSRIPLGGQITAPGANEPFLRPDPDNKPEWFAYGKSTTSVEKISGQHAPYQLVLCDEASGINDKVFEGLKGLTADKYVLIGNPLYPYGPFYDWFRLAESGEKGYGCTKVSCFESPDIDLWKSERGLACQSSLEMIRTSDGEGSIYWTAHVLGEFPLETSESLIPRDWLDIAEKATHVPGGPKRIGVDLALGGGGDSTVIVVRDDNGIYEILQNNQWDLGQTARQVERLASAYNVMPRHITYDGNGPGADFANRLKGVGIIGARNFVGMRNSGIKISRYADDRTTAAYALKRRLDPDWVAAAPKGDQPAPKSVPFAIKKEHMAILRPQLLSYAVENAEDNKIRLISKDEIMSRLGHSPDAADALALSFFYKV